MLANKKFDRAHLVVSHGIDVAACAYDHIHTQHDLAATRAIPAMADAAVLLQVLLACPAVNLNSVTEVIRGDLGLTIQLLRLVSLADDSPSDEVSIPKTVVHVGVGGLSYLAGQIELLSSYRQGKASLRECEQFWGHARLTALMAEELAYKSDCDADQAYLAGLLFHIGELPSLLGWDWGLTGADCREVAEVLAKLWHLPSSLQGILCGDDLQLPARSRTLLQLVRVADQQAWRVGGLVSRYARRVF
jgi:HD-like signal output (HDOD) protein